jgi:predicted nucleotidyltransferase
MGKGTTRRIGGTDRRRSVWRPSKHFGRSCTDMIRLPNDFKEFLRLLNSNGVEYMLVGGYAVGFHGYPRTTGDMDIWVATNARNAEKIVDVLRRFGFGQAELKKALFMTADNVVRMGVPPIRIELITSISGVEFDQCFQRAVTADIDGIAIPVIALDDLRANKRAANRAKDRGDLEELEGK